MRGLCTGRGEISLVGAARLAGGGMPLFFSGGGGGGLLGGALGFGGGPLGGGGLACGGGAIVAAAAAAAMPLEASSNCEYVMIVCYCSFSDSRGFDVNGCSVSKQRAIEFLTMISFFGSTQRIHF